MTKENADGETQKMLFSSLGKASEILFWPFLVTEHFVVVAAAGVTYSCK